MPTDSGAVGFRVMTRGILIASLALFPSLAFAADGPTRREPPKTIAQQIQELRTLVEALTARVEALEAENRALRETGGKPVAGQQPDAVAKAMRAGKIAHGMTLEQVEKVTRGGVTGKGELKESNASGYAVYRWQISNSLNVVDDRDRGKLNSYLLTCEFKDGKLVSFTVHDL